MRPLLEIRRLCRDFYAGGLRRGKILRAVDDVSLQLYAGEALGLAGESACGKTTLARCALRLLEPTSGEVVFDGCDLGRLAPAELRRRRREFQMVFQDAAASLDPRMPVGRILSEPLAFHGIGTRAWREARVRALMQAVGLEEALISRYPGQLSGGQQQRIVIARALALQPRLLVADEPVTALDASVQAQILNLLARIRRDHELTLLLISHSLPALHYLCSTIAVMYMGRLVEIAPAENFFARPLHPYSRLLCATAAPREAGGDEAPADARAPARPETGCLFHPRCPAASAVCRSRRPELEPVGERIAVACFLHS
jgi:peptide/nickel transport system ATP-binding protein